MESTTGGHEEIRAEGRGLGGESPCLQGSLKGDEEDEERQAGIRT